MPRRKPKRSRELKRQWETVRIVGIQRQDIDPALMADIVILMGRQLAPEAKGRKESAD